MLFSLVAPVFDLQRPDYYLEEFKEIIGLMPALRVIDGSGAGQLLLLLI